MIELINISKSYGGQKVLDFLNFTFNPGSIYLLTGKNGSGKTTLFNIISGFEKQDSGELKINQQKIESGKPYKIFSKDVSRSFQDLRLIQDFTVFKNIELSMFGNRRESIFMSAIQIKRNSKYNTHNTHHDEQIRDIANRLHIDNLLEKETKMLSYGEQKLLSIACVVARNPKIILLDEPFAGISRNIRKEEENSFKDHIKNMILDLMHEDDSRIIMMIDHEKVVGNIGNIINLKLIKGKIV